MGRIPDEIISKVIEYNDIVDVISDYINLKKVGRSYVGVCPFHNDRGPSLSVSPDKQLFHCFGCGAAGNVIGFIMKIKNLEFKDAVLYLAERADINIDLNDKKDENTKYKERLYKANLEAARFFYKNLKASKVAVNYLLSRGIDYKIINRFGLGFSLNEWNSLLKYLKKLGFKDEEIISAGLVINSDKGIYDRFRNRIMFPIFDIKGRVIGFGGRVIDDSKPKYLNTSETLIFEKGKNLYGLNYVIKNKSANSIIIVEGYMDCIKLHQHGLENVVASLGTALTLEQAKLLKRYVNDIYICYDSDAAGQAATLRGLEILESVGLNVKVINIPQGKDPDEYVNNYGIEEFKKLIDEAIYITDYRILKAREGKNLKNQFDKIQYVNQVINILSKLKDDVLIHHYSEQLSNETGIALSVIIEKINKSRTLSIEKNNNPNLRNNIKGNIYNLIPAYKKAEALILAILLYNDNSISNIISKISPDDFITDVYKDLARDIYSKLLKGESININKDEYMAKYQNSEDISDIARVFAYDINSLNLSNSDDTIISDAIKTIKRYSIEEKINHLKNEIKNCEKENNIQKSIDLMQRLVALQKELEHI
ncbi:DNA primase [Thermobrachium celere]|uniref:DNA primase n=2 Tax=Thermobrachium TaxID=150333 RepID=R7RPV3_9CLOT|nr:DNA primase [Thermobrachium celere]CDF58054.1 DNA primase [Thermobrachium celere DSM 8682]